jgi:hypothetical protein
MVLITWNAFFLDALITSDRVVIRSLDFECARESFVFCYVFCIPIIPNNTMYPRPYTVTFGGFLPMTGYCS